MIIGTRVLYPEEVDFWNAEILQISVYHGMKGSLDFMRECSSAFRDAGLRYVIHPVGYSLLQEEIFNELREMAQQTDRALILHDERNPDGTRLGNEWIAKYRKALERLSSIARVSIENAADTPDIRWFWDTFADSITLDIGHVESAGLNSVEFVHALDEQSLKKVRFVHIHRNNGLHGGITDHWPLSPGCREIRALEELVRVKPDVSVILEINEVEEIDESLSLLRELRARIQ